MAEDTISKARRLLGKIKHAKLIRAFNAWQGHMELERSIQQVQEAVLPYAAILELPPPARKPRDVDRLAQLLQQASFFPGLLPPVVELLATHCSLTLVWDTVELPRSSDEAAALFCVLSGSLQCVVADGADPVLQLLVQRAAKQVIAAAADARPDPAAAPGPLATPPGRPGSSGGAGRPGQGSRPVSAMPGARTGAGAEAGAGAGGCLVRGKDQGGGEGRAAEAEPAGEGGGGGGGGGAGGGQGVPGESVGLSPRKADLLMSLGLGDKYCVAEVRRGLWHQVVDMVRKNMVPSRRDADAWVARSTGSSQPPLLPPLPASQGSSTPRGPPPLPSPPPPALAPTAATQPPGPGAPGAPPSPGSSSPALLLTPGPSPRPPAGLADASASHGASGNNAGQEAAGGAGVGGGGGANTFMGVALVDMQAWGVFSGRDLDCRDESGLQDCLGLSFPTKVLAAVTKPNTMAALLTFTKQAFRRAMALQQDLAVLQAVNACCRLPCLRHTPLKELYRLAKYMVQMQYSKGEPLLQQGKEVTNMHFLIQGWVEVVVDVPLSQDAEVVESALSQGHREREEGRAAAQLLAQGPGAAAAAGGGAGLGAAGHARNSGRSQQLWQGPLQRVVLARRGPGAVLGDDGLREKRMAVSVLAATPEVVTLSVSHQRFAMCVDALTMRLLQHLRVQQGSLNQMAAAVAGAGARQQLLEQCKQVVLAQSYQGQDLPPTLQPHVQGSGPPWVASPALAGAVGHRGPQPHTQSQQQAAADKLQAKTLPQGVTSRWLRGMTMSPSLVQLADLIKGVEAKRAVQPHAMSLPGVLATNSGGRPPVVVQQVELTDSQLVAASSRQHTDMWEVCCLAVIQVLPLPGQSSVAPEVLSPVLDDASVAWSSLVHSQHLQLVRWSSNQHFLMAPMDPSSQQRPVVRVVADTLLQMRDAFDKVIATNPVPYFIFAAGLVIGGLFASYDCGRFLTSLAGQAFGAATFLCAQAVDQALVGGAILASDAVAQALLHTHHLQFCGPGFLLEGPVHLPFATPFDAVYGRGATDKDPVAPGVPRMTHKSRLAALGPPSHSAGPGLAAALTPAASNTSQAMWDTPQPSPSQAARPDQQHRGAPPGLQPVAQPQQLLPAMPTQPPTNSQPKTTARDRGGPARMKCRPRLAHSLQRADDLSTRGLVKREALSMSTTMSIRQQLRAELRVLAPDYPYTPDLSRHPHSTFSPSRPPPTPRGMQALQAVHDASVAAREATRPMNLSPRGIGGLDPGNGQAPQTSRVAKDPGTAGSCPTAASTPAFGFRSKTSAESIAAISQGSAGGLESPHVPVTSRITPYGPGTGPLASLSARRRSSAVLFAGAVAHATASYTAKPLYQPPHDHESLQSLTTQSARPQEAGAAKTGVRLPQRLSPSYTSEGGRASSLSPATRRSSSLTLGVNRPRTPQPSSPLDDTQALSPVLTFDSTKVRPRTSNSRDMQQQPDLSAFRPEPGLRAAAVTRSLADGAVAGCAITAAMSQIRSADTSPENRHGKHPLSHAHSAAVASIAAAVRPLSPGASPVATGVAPPLHIISPAMRLVPPRSRSAGHSASIEPLAAAQQRTQYVASNLGLIPVNILQQEEQRQEQRQQQQQQQQEESQMVSQGQVDPIHDPGRQPAQQPNPFGPSPNPPGLPPGLTLAAGPPGTPPSPPARHPHASHPHPLHLPSTPHCGSASPMAGSTGPSRGQPGSPARPGSPGPPASTYQGAPFGSAARVLDPVTGLSRLDVHKQAVTTWKDLGSSQAAARYVAQLPAGLVNINFSAASLPALPDLSRLSRLESLATSFNMLGPLTSAQVAGLGTSLKQLCLTNSHISLLPADMGRWLPCLVELNLGHNAIASIPASLCSLPKLRCLSLEHNELSQLPSSFWQLYSLQALWLGHNSLTHLPDTLDRLPGLALLHAPHNNLEAVPRSLLARGSSLLSLDLAHNQLRQLPPGFLRSLSRLTSLDLSHNQLCSCPQLQGPHATTQLFDADLAHEAAGVSPSNSPVILRTISMVLPRPRAPASPTLEDHEARGRGSHGNSHPSPCSLGVHPPALSTSNSEPDTVRLSAAEAVAASLASGCLNLRTPSTPSLAAVAQYQATGPAYRRMSSLRVQTNTSLVLELSTGARSPVQASPSALQVGTSCADHSVTAAQAFPASPLRIGAHARGAHGRAATSAVDDVTSTHKGAMPLLTQALHPGWSQGATPPSPPQQQDEHQALSKRRRAVLVPISPPQPFADVVQSALASPSPEFAVHSATSQATAADAAADAVTDAAFLAGWEDGHSQQALPELGFLSIAGNQLRHVPAWLPSRLRTLDLSKNLLSQVPEWLSTRMAQLQVLCLYSNHLEEVPSELLTLRLRCVALDDNPLTDPSLHGSGATSFAEAFYKEKAACKHLAQTPP